MGKLRYFDNLAREFHKASKKRREEIFKEVAAVYLPKIKKRLEGYSSYDYDCIMSEYNWIILDSLNTWKQNSSILTYIFVRIKATFRQHFYSLKVVKGVNNKVHQLDSSIIENSCAESILDLVTQDNSHWDQNITQL